MTKRNSTLLSLDDIISNLTIAPIGQDEFTISDLIAKTGRSRHSCTQHMNALIESGKVLRRYAIVDGKRVCAYKIIA